LSSIGSAIDFPDCWGLVKIEVVRETRTWAITTYSYSRESGKSKNLSKACTGNQIPQRKNWKKFSCFSMLSNGFHYSFSNVPQIPHNQIRKKKYSHEILFVKRLHCVLFVKSLNLQCVSFDAPPVRLFLRVYEKCVGHTRNRTINEAIVGSFL
jgi:hypothetical protein